jgi:hypothetical protein
MPAGMQVTVGLIKKATAAGAWAAAGTDTNVPLAGFPITGWTIGEPVGELIVDTTFGQAQPKDADAGNLNLAGDITCFARYDSLTLPLALTMGIAGVPVTVGVTGFEHTLKWATSVDQLVATMAMNTITSVDEFPSLKFSGFTLRQVTGQPADLTFNAIANTKRYSTDSGDPPAATGLLAAVTTVPVRYRLMGHHLKVRANLQTGGALASPTDDITPSEIVLTVNRNMVGDFVFNGSRIIDEPELDNVPTSTLQLNWPVHRAQTDTFLRHAKNDVELKLDLTWTHPDATGTGTAPYLFRVDVPRARIGAPTKTTSGPGRIPYQMTLQLLKPDAAPTGMPLLTDFLQLFMRNRRSTNPLATAAGV